MTGLKREKSVKAFFDGFAKIVLIGHAKSGTKKKQSKLLMANKIKIYFFYLLRFLLSAKCFLEAAATRWSCLNFLVNWNTLACQIPLKPLELSSVKFKG